MGNNLRSYHDGLIFYLLLIIIIKYTKSYVIFPQCALSAAHPQASLTYLHLHGVPGSLCSFVLFKCQECGSLTNQQRAEN